MAIAASPELYDHDLRPSLLASYQQSRLGSQLEVEVRCGPAHLGSLRLTATGTFRTAVTK